MNEAEPPQTSSAPSAIVYALGFDALIRQTQALERENEGVLNRDDIEHVHRMRVATRRLRAILELLTPGLGPRAARLRRRARRITRALGRARDLDVQIDFLDQELKRRLSAGDRAALSRLRLRLCQKRDEVQSEVERALGASAAPRLCKAVAEHVQEWQSRRASHLLIFYPVLNAIADLLAFESYVSYPGRIQEHHQMRIAAKRLRYMLETLQPANPDGLGKRLGPIREVQTFLGDIHDCDVWKEVIVRFLVEEKQRMVAFYGHTRGYRKIAAGCERFRKRVKARRRRLHRDFVARWVQLQREGFWEATCAELERLFCRNCAAPPEGNTL
jgi:CHAD domain-containing protein